MYGLTPLGMAVREGQLDTIRYLITEYNVDVNGKLHNFLRHCIQVSKKMNLLLLCVCVNFLVGKLILLYYLLCDGIIM